MALFSASEASAGDIYLQVWPSQLQERFRQIEGDQSLENMPWEDGLKELGLSSRTETTEGRGCVTFIQ